MLSVPARPSSPALGGVFRVNRRKRVDMASFSLYRGSTTILVGWIMTKKHLCFLLSASFIACFASAQDDYFLTNRVTLFQFNGGWAEPDTDSAIFDFSEEMLTFDADEMDGTVWSFNIYRQLNELVAVGGGWSFHTESVPSEDRFYEYENGTPILQETQLDTTWFGLLAQITPLGAGTSYGTRAWAPRVFVPYIQFGVGFVGWDFSQSGEFVDVDTLEVFLDHFSDDGVAAALRAGVGCRINLHKNIDMDFNMLYTHAEDDLEGDFEGFGELNLSSRSVNMGFIIRI